MPKNYYAILGIPPDAGADEIKSAYRQRAMERHPDRTGAERGPFQDVQEAYTVLSDPERRKKYDSDQRQAVVEHRAWPQQDEPLRFWSPEIEIDVTPEEARHGGRMRLVLPLEVTCPECGGWGSAGFYLCRGCGGAGSVRDDYMVEVGFPAGIISTHTIRLPVPQMASGRAFTVRFRVR